MLLTTGWDAYPSQPVTTQHFVRLQKRVMLVKSPCNIVNKIPSRNKEFCWEKQFIFIIQFWNPPSLQKQNKILIQRLIDSTLHWEKWGGGENVSKQVKCPKTFDMHCSYNLKEKWNYAWNLLLYQQMKIINTDQPTLSFHHPIRTF